MKILALDQSLKSTGWAVFEDTELKDYGKFTIPANQSLPNRLGEIFVKLTCLYHDYEFDKIIFEDIQEQHKNVVTFKHLAYVQAAVLLWCYWNEVQYEILAPSSWRKILGGKFGRKREEQKQHAIDLVKDCYDIEVDSDTADAICIGRAGILQGATTDIGFGSLN